MKSLELIDLGIKASSTRVIDEYALIEAGTNLGVGCYKDIPVFTDWRQIIGRAKLQRRHRHTIHLLKPTNQYFRLLGTEFSFSKRRKLPKALQCVCILWTLSQINLPGTMRKKFIQWTMAPSSTGSRAPYDNQNCTASLSIHVVIIKDRNKYVVLCSLTTYTTEINITTQFTYMFASYLSSCVNIKLTFCAISISHIRACMSVCVCVAKRKILGDVDAA